jgi:pyruvate/2-oxoglutarate/acetoin dehydrogenase E1 component
MTTVLQSLNEALHETFAADPRVVLLGEDLLDPYGGAFKVSRGLSSAYPNRVLASSISEAGITGVAAGMALRGLRPVVEIMFGDFITLAADQLINHIAKFRWMYNDQVTLPLVIRTPMGGRRGYGPTHSQTLEKHFLGVPGLRVIAPCNLQGLSEHEDGAGGLLKHLILESQSPVLFIENKLLYLLPMQGSMPQAELEIQVASTIWEGVTAPTFVLRVAGAPAPGITLAAYGYMADLARQAMMRLAYEHEIFSELVVLTQLSPFELAPVLDSAQRTRRLLTIEEGALSAGWGAEVLAQAAQKMGPNLLRTDRVGALDLPVPASAPLEAAVLPDVNKIVAHARQMWAERRYN